MTDNGTELLWSAVLGHIEKPLARAVDVFATGKPDPTRELVVSVALSTHGKRSRGDSCELRVLPIERECEEKVLLGIEALERLHSGAKISVACDKNCCIKLISGGTFQYSTGNCHVSLLLLVSQEALPRTGVPCVLALEVMEPYVYSGSCKGSNICTMAGELMRVLNGKMISVGSKVRDAFKC